MSHTFRSLYTAVDSAPTQAELDIANLVALYVTSNPNYDFQDESHADTDSNSIKVYSRNSHDGTKRFWCILTLILTVVLVHLP